MIYEVLELRLRKCCTACTIALRWYKQTKLCVLLTLRTVRTVCLKTTIVVYAHVRVGLIFFYSCSIMHFRAKFSTHNRWSSCAFKLRAKTNTYVYHLPRGDSEARKFQVVRVVEADSKSVRSWVMNATDKNQRPFRKEFALNMTMWWKIGILESQEHPVGYSVKSKTLWSVLFTRVKNSPADRTGLLRFETVTYCFRYIVERKCLIIIEGLQMLSSGLTLDRRILKWSKDFVRNFAFANQNLIEKYYLRFS